MWTSADQKATVYSMHPRIWRMCEKAGGIEIRQEDGARERKKAARTFLVDVDFSALFEAGEKTVCACTCSAREVK